MTFDLDFLQRALHGGPITLAGLGMLALAGLLLLACVFLSMRHRRLSLILGAASVGLGLLGYIASDWEHVSLNLAMRDASAVRKECIRLLQQQRQATPEDGYRGQRLFGSEIPASFTRIGATYVCVEYDYVTISVMPYNRLTSSAWGFLYDPSGTYSKVRGSEGVRPTWYHEFYEFRVRGE